jgi:hypothetical protein
LRGLIMINGTRQTESILFRDCILKYEFLTAVTEETSFHFLHKKFDPSMTQYIFFSKILVRLAFTINKIRMELYK